MSDIVQSGIHPDADQLSAFVEHALPAHEQRQLLAHLAICADCRSIVALSLLPLEEAQRLQLMPEATPLRHQPGFANWKLAWPALAGLAAIVLLVLHFRNPAPIRDRAPVAGQVADARPPAPSATPSGPLFSQYEQTTRRSAKAASAIGQRASSALSTSAPSGGDAVRKTQRIQPLPLQNRNLVSQGTASGAVGEPLASPAAGIFAGSSVSQNSLAATPGAPHPGLANGQPTGPANSAAPTINASSMSRSLALDQARNIFAQTPLPSGLPVLSMATDAQQRLAIDTQNNLFFSEDEGKHWKAVSPPWKGRAVRVALASSSLSYPQGGPTINGHLVSPASPAAANSSLTGAIVDPSGAVVSGATVVATDIHTAVVRTGTTNSAGRYGIDRLPPGSYQVAARAPGFNTQSLSADLRPSQQVVMNFTLSIGAAAETVTVQSTAPELAPSPVDSTNSIEPSPPAPPIFAITTDAGERWTSVDGQSWKLESSKSH